MVNEIDLYLENTERTPFSLKWKDARENCIAMGLADMDFNTPKFIINAIQEYLGYNNLGYYKIPSDFYTSIVNWYKTKFNFPINSSEIIATTGVIPSLRGIIYALTTPGDKILIQEPVYHYFKKVILDLNRIAIINELQKINNKYEIDFIKLEEQLKDDVKVFILCSPHNPIGRVWTKKELFQISELCDKYNVLLVSDEVHSDLCMPNQNFLSYYETKSKSSDLCIILNSPTKSFNFAGLRGGYIIVKNSELSKKILHAIANLGIDKVNAIYVTAVIAAYKYGKKWNASVINYINDNYLFLVNYLKEHAPFLQVCHLQATYLVWIDYSKLNISEEKFIKTISNKIIVEPGTIFGLSGKNYFRINISCPRITLKVALDSIATICNEFYYNRD